MTVSSLSGSTSKCINWHVLFNIASLFWVVCNGLICLVLSVSTSECMHWQVIFSTASLIWAACNWPFAFLPRFVSLPATYSALDIIKSKTSFKKKCPPDSVFFQGDEFENHELSRYWFLGGFRQSHRLTAKMSRCFPFGILRAGLDISKVSTT